MKLHRTLAMLGAASALLANSAVFSADITIGIRSEPSSMDPYFHNLGPNNAMLGHIFGRAGSSVYVEPALCEQLRSIPADSTGGPRYEDRSLILSALCSERRRHRTHPHDEGDESDADGVPGDGHGRPPGVEEGTRLSM